MHPGGASACGNPSSGCPWVRLFLTPLCPLGITNSSTLRSRYLFDFPHLTKRYPHNVGMAEGSSRQSNAHLKTRGMNWMLQKQYLLTKLYQYSCIYRPTWQRYRGRQGRLQTFRDDHTPSFSGGGAVYTTKTTTTTTSTTEVTCQLTDVI